MSFILTCSFPVLWKGWVYTNLQKYHETTNTRPTLSSPDKTKRANRGIVQKDPNHFLQDPKILAWEVTRIELCHSLGHWRRSNGTLQKQTETKPRALAIVATKRPRPAKLLQLSVNSSLHILSLCKQISILKQPTCPVSSLCESRQGKHARYFLHTVFPISSAPSKSASPCLLVDIGRLQTLIDSLLCHCEILWPCFGTPSTLSLFCISQNHASNIPIKTHCLPRYWPINKKWQQVEINQRSMVISQCFIVTTNEYNGCILRYSKVP